MTSPGLEGTVPYFDLLYFSMALSHCFHVYSYCLELKMLGGAYVSLLVQCISFNLFLEVDTYVKMEHC